MIKLLVILFIVITKITVSEISGVASGQKAFLYQLEYLSMTVSVTNQVDHHLTSIGFYFKCISFSKTTVHTCIYFHHFALNKTNKSKKLQTKLKKQTFY